jgi:hypothetical protein|tara:strand:+ start:7503 stop:7649 length:147 start_codon:yes stop_codon:yes gene_type:complete
MLGMNSFASGAMSGLSLGLVLGFLNVISYQVAGTGAIDWAASKTGGSQ